MIAFFYPGSGGPFSGIKQGKNRLELTVTFFMNLNECSREFLLTGLFV